MRCAHLLRSFAGRGLATCPRRRASLADGDEAFGIRFMRKKILEHCNRYTPILSGVWRLLVCHAQDVISELRELSWQDLRKGFTVNFVMTLLNLAMFTYFIWGFDHIDRLYDSIVLNLLPAYFPPVAFYQAMRQKPEARRFDWWYAGFALFLGLALLLVVSDRHDLHELGINVVVVMTSAPWLIVFGMLVRGKRILAIGMVPAAVLLMAYWVAPVISEGSELQYFLIPLPAVSILLAAWTFLVWLLFKGVDRWPQDETLGPLMESLAMLSLFLPIMVLAIWLPRTIPGGEDWSVVLAAMVGVVFGSVISEPLTRFLRSYGNLPSARKDEDERRDAP